MDFERYRVPAAVRDGVWIELPGTKDAKFLVSLPTEHNRAYSAALQRALPLRLDGTGHVGMGEFDYVEWQATRIEAFLTHCILEFPAGMTAEQMRTDYYPGLVALFTLATDMAEDDTKQAKAATKKSKA